MHDFSSLPSTNSQGAGIKASATIAPIRELFTIGTIVHLITSTRTPSIERAATFEKGKSSTFIREWIWRARLTKVDLSSCSAGFYASAFVPISRFVSSPGHVPHPSACRTCDF